MRVLVLVYDDETYVNPQRFVIDGWRDSGPPPARTAHLGRHIPDDTAPRKLIAMAAGAFAERLGDVLRHNADLEAAGNPEIDPENAGDAMVAIAGLANVARESALFGLRHTADQFAHPPTNTEETRP